MHSLKWLTLSLALILSAGLAAPASARAATTTCAGELAGLTIAGDVSVPAGEQCALIGTTVLGDVRVYQRATLEVIESRVEGSLVGSNFELVALRDASVGGRVRLDGGVTSELERATVAGDVRLIRQLDARVLESQVAGDLVVRGTRELALLCGTTVGGSARFAGHRGGLLIGDNPFAPGACGANEVRGDLLVHSNRSDTIVANSAVGRNLVCAANRPAPAVYGNQVGGRALGQCGAGEAVDLADLGDDA